MLEMRRLEQDKCTELKLFEQLFSPTTQCHKNDQSVINTISVK